MKITRWVAGGAAALLIATATTALGAPEPTGAGCVTRPADQASPEVAALAGALKVSRSEAAVRIGWQNSAEQLDRASRAAGKASYGGLWIDTKTARIKLGSTGADAALRSAAAGCGLAGAVDVVRVKHGASTLEAASEWLGDRIVGSRSGLGAGLSYDANAVHLDLPADRALSSSERALVSEAVRMWGDAVRVRSLPGSDAPTACTANGHYCDPSLRGGIRMNEGCTLGFIVRSRSDNVLYAMTAGHCGGGTWTTNFTDGTTHTIGPVHNSVYGAAGDAQIIRISNPSGWSPRAWVLVRASADTTRDETYHIGSVGGSTIGMRICKTGYTAGSDCGTVTELNYTATYGVQHLGVANFCVSPGDSGGPVYASHVAYGITSGHRTGASPCRSYYQGARGAEDLMNVNIALGSS